MNMDRTAILAQASFFQGLSPASREALADVCRPRDLRKHEVLFREDERGSAMYLLAAGHVRLHKTGPDGAEVVIKIIAPGETFAEVVLFEEDRYPVTAVALAASRVFVFLRQDIQHLLGASGFRRDFIGMLMRKQRYLTEKIRQLTVHDVETRFLAFLREQYGLRDVIQTTLSKKDIAAAIGATPETLSRLIQRLRRRKAIIWTGRTIRFVQGSRPRPP
ncbi:MAG: Crp/Fnr family transcriptional regulator [Kiritimatiellaeota bacterium]|nr:Crp/Fnr family transcriptional regulator [Kiritimatiellota bacterium]